MNASCPWVMMEAQRLILQSIQKNQLDRVQLISYLNRYQIDFDVNSPLVILKFKLKLRLLDNLIQYCHNDNEVVSKYTSLKNESENFLRYHNEKVTSSNFKCTFSGCLFESRVHREYMRHLQRVHPNADRLVCKFGRKCMRVFSSLALLNDHLENHTVRQPSHGTDADSAVSYLEAEIPCKCAIQGCGDRQFIGIRKLMLHMQNDHARLGQLVSCIYENCSKEYDNGNSLRSHFRLKHLKKGQFQLKLKNRLEVLSDQSGHREVSLSQTADLLIHDLNTLEVTQEYERTIDYSESSDGASGDDSTESNEVFMMAYCDFLNRLQNFQFIPQSSINLISKDYLRNYLKSNEAKSRMLRESLKKHVLDISDDVVEEIIADLESGDAFLKAQADLDSDYKRLQYLKENFVYIAPEQIVLNQVEMKRDGCAKEVMHYVSIVETMKNLVKDNTFIEVTENNTSGQDYPIRDVKDGLVYRNNPYFSSNPGAFTLMLYADGVEVVNPLGAGRGKHKVVQIFFTVAEIPKAQRSKIDRIQLVAVIKEKYLKKYGYGVIYDRIVKDLVQLEKGVQVSHPVPSVIKCGLLLCPADNLEGRLRLCRLTTFVS